MTNSNMKFVTDVFSEDESNIIVFGVECPQSLREASQLVEPFDITKQKNLLENAKIFDAGDFTIEDAENKVAEIVASGKTPLILAKEHTVTLQAMKAMPKQTRLIVFDAHADVKDEYEGSKQSHACWLRRWTELDEANAKRVAIVGVRSGDEEELQFLKSNGILFLTSDEIKNDVQSGKKRLGNFIGDDDVYISLDVDVFDPSIAPAVKYPEPGGILYREFLQLIEFLQNRKVVGLDCVEIRPLGENRITEFLAVKTVFRILGSV